MLAYGVFKIMQRKKLGVTVLLSDLHAQQNTSSLSKFHKQVLP